VASVFSGVALAQAIPVLGSLLIARIYAPDEFGHFSAWLGASAILAVLLTLRLEAAFGLETDGEERQGLVASTVLLVVSFSTALFLLALALTIYEPTLLSGLSTPLILLFPVMGMMTALSQVWQSWAANDGAIGKLSSIRIVQAFSVTVLQIVAGLLWPVGAALAGAQVLGTAIALCFALWIMPVSLALLNSVKRRGHFQSVWSRYKKFPTYALPADLMNTAGAQLPILVITSRFGLEVAGYYALTIRVMGAPIGLLGAAVRDVFKRSANEEYRAHGTCRHIYVKTFLVLAVFSLLMVVGTVFLAEPIFTTVFGETWKMSGVMAIWLVPMFAMRFIASPLSYTFYVAQKQNVDLMWQIGLLAMTITTLVLPNGYQSMLIYYSLGYAAMYVVYVYLSYRAATPKAIIT